ncbi:MAG TPA: 4-amino-4-deoxy-L-arabinose-phospho-UDP flippase [Rhodospirillaceae bacterium]|nr:4-amino-4-deoxy-L-arabinose-phospho-UDP flippase [Rhodospirillaceae bacterium]
METKLVYAALLLAVAANAVGQILFKLSADRIREGSDGILTAYFTSPYIWGAVAFYFGASVVWVWVLQWLPISTAYPVMSLVFVLVPLAGIFLFQETQDLRFFLGVAMIVAGILIVTVRAP